ncbi:MAG: hypothetical protein ACK2U1_07215 [Anaerolineales bacterium]
MIQQNSKKLVFAILAIVLVSLSCGPPRFTPEGTDLEEAQAEIFSNIAGAYQSVGEIDDLSAITGIEQACAPTLTSYAGKQETLAFDQNTLVITDENGPRTYTYQNFEQFCRELDNGNIECIDQLSYDGVVSDGYTLNIYESRKNFKLCFTGVVPHAAANPSSSADNQSDETENSSEASTDEFQSSPAFDPASCWAAPSDYTLEIVNLSDESNAKKRSCNADGQITNNGDDELMFAIYRVNHYGSSDFFGEKWHPGYQVIHPGETVEYGGFHHCTGGNCKEGEWFYIQRLSILRNESGCIRYNDGFEDKAPESIVQIENPCDW